MGILAKECYARGIEKMQLSEPLAALEAFEQAIALDPSRAAYRSAKGGALHSLRRYREAEQALRKAVRLAKDDASLRVNLAIALESLGRMLEALEQYDFALTLDPACEAARLNRGGLLMRIGRFDAALENNLKLVEFRPDCPVAQFNLGESLLTLGRWREAVAACDRALELRPGYVKALFDRAVGLSMQAEFAAAREALDSAKRLDEVTYRQCLENIGRVLGTQERPFDPAPELIYLIGMFGRQEACDWEGRDEYIRRFQEWLGGGESFLADQSLAFYGLSLPLGAQRHIDLCRMVSSRLVEETGAPLPALRRECRERIRIGYVSPDFRVHPVGRLTRRIYGLHDRSLFEVYAYSLRPDDGSFLHRNIREGCDRFFDVSHFSIPELAKKIQEDEIDILVDLAGYTTFSVMGTFALKPAPMQVGYLGFPGSAGADFLDYLITDFVTSPPGSETYYSECLVRLPRAYLVYDNEQTVAPMPSRSEAGLPEEGVVFCCFNNAYKIEPEVFSVWMRILSRIPGSVLWLFRAKPEVETNLRKKAKELGIDPGRLIFSPFEPDFGRYLARYRLADLFLDTPVNAHTTAADALWAGLPVLTQPKETHWSRVAASLLVSIGLPELVVRGLDEYEAAAVHLTSIPGEIGRLKEKLALCRESQPLFDTEGFVCYLEQAYQTMWERHQAGLPPEAFSVPA